MPALFVGHGSPMNAIEDNEFRRGWADAARRLPRPKAVLCVSAHWETRGVAVTAADYPETIHDFHGFPRPLCEIRYPAPGDLPLVRRTADLVRGAHVAADRDRGLDHGAWSVLAAMYPKADVPVVQLSLDTTRPAAFHYGLGRDLAPLRGEGVLILGSGNIVHNLHLVDFERSDGADWALRFGDEVHRRIVERDHAALVEYPSLGPDAPRAVPTPEHYLPLLYVLAVQGASETAAFFNQKTVMGSISMESVTVGE